ncbi:MAG: ABC transporter permease subunit [Kiritimatiellae bacterium]|nr:ABC transporter permease subunit [Kiritimatiellia bacterium]
MGGVRTTWVRECRAFRGSFSCAIPVTAFLAVCGWSFVAALRQSEGSVLQLQTIWGLSVAPWLPILGAVLTMRLFADERATGMIDLLLTAPIRERDLVVGKFLSAMVVVAFALLLTMVAPAFLLPFLSDPLAHAFRVGGFLATFAILLLQAATWCAAGMMVSAFCRNQAASAVTSLILCSGLPVAGYVAILFWFPSLRANMAAFPILTHVYDFSTGLFSTGVVCAYLVAALFFLFTCSKRLVWLRLKG